MAATIKHKNGTTTTPSITGTPALFVEGPAQSGAKNQKGLYMLESGSQGASGTYAWREDVTVDATIATVSAFSAAPR